MKVKVALILCLLLSCGVTAYAAFWSSGTVYPVSKLGQPDTPCPSTTGSPTATPTSSATATATPTATATATPGALPSAVTAMLGDVGNGVTNPVPTLCAAAGASANGCTTQGSASTASIPTNGTDAGPALQTALNAGDVNLPAATYTINTQVNVPSYRTLQCQPGAILTTTATTIKMLNLSGIGQSTTVGCTFVGTGASPASNEYAEFVTGGQNINFVGNTVSGFPASSAVTFSAANDDVIELNLFSGNHDSGLLTSGSTHIVNVFNNTGALSPAVPAITNTGGSLMQRHLWTVLAALGASGTPAAAGYSLVTPGAVFGGNTCHGNGATDDTACIASALAAGTAGIILTAGTGGTPYYAMSGTITGGQLNGKTVLCEPGAQFLDTQTVGTGSTPTWMFALGAGGFATGTNINFVGCQMYGKFTNPATQTISGGNYNELVEISTGGGSAQIHGIGLDLEACFGDCWITYSPCGQQNLTQCSGGANPQLSGPNDIALTFSNLYSSVQVAMHANGGQNVHNVFDRIGDADAGPEVDDNVMQIIQMAFDNIYYYSIDGVNNAQIPGRWRSPQIGCSDRQNVGADYSGCYEHGVLADGALTASPGASGTGPWFPANEIHLTPSNGLSGNTGIACKPGNYLGNPTAHGGLIDHSNGDSC